MRSFSTRTAGFLILILGIWGGVIPFIGHYFHFALGPDKSWTWTSGRLYLDVLPAIAAVLGGLMLIGAGPRPHARLGALLAIAAGIWFAIGPDVSYLWNAAGAQGAAHGSTGIRALEAIAYHTGLGALMAALGGYSLPRFVAAREAVAAPARTRAGAPAAAGTAAVGPERRAARDETLAGAPPRARREPAATAAPAREQGTSAGDMPAASREAEAAEAPAAGRTGEQRRNEQAAGPPSEPVAGPSEPVAGGTEPEAGGTGQGAGATQTANRSDPYASRGQVVRRRRGGLLSSLFSKR